MTKGLRLLIGLLLLVAACGGGEEVAESSPTTAAAEGSSDTTATTTAAPTTTTTQAPAVNASDDFCEFVVAAAQNSDFSPLGLNPSDLEARLTETLDEINRGAELAPSEIRDDVVMFAETYAGFVELLSDYGFNFLAIGEDALDDPRLTALEDPALTEAGERIEAYCGVDNFIVVNPQAPGGGGTTSGGEPPEGIPAEFIPDGANILSQINAAGSTSVVYQIDRPLDEMISFYEDLLGDATQVLDDPPGASWVTFSAEGLITSVVVSEAVGGGTDVGVSFAG